MHQDPRVWKDPEKFDPDRYRDHPKLAPEYVAGGDWEKRDHYGYGAGRRICPGMYLAERNLLVAIAKLIWAFKFEHQENPDGQRLPVDSDPFSGYNSGFMYCSKNYGCKPVVRSETIRETIMREFEDTARPVFDKFDVN